MFCCSNCFVDSEIKAIIKSYNTIGNCEFCGQKNVHVYDLEKDLTLAELFDGLLDVYSPLHDLPDTFPLEHASLLKDALFNSWHIFNLKPDMIYRLITAISNERYILQPSLFDQPVGIRQIQDSSFLEENSILRNHCWKDFVEGIIRVNRFHSDYINKDKLYLFLRCAAKNIIKAKSCIAPEFLRIKMVFQEKRWVRLLTAMQRAAE